MRQLSNNTSQYLRGDGTWQTLQNNGTTSSAGYALDARMGKTLLDKINIIGSTSSASGTYTTKVWAEGTNTCVWKAPAAGTYLITCRWTCQSDSSIYRQYKQFSLRGTCPRVYDNFVYFFEHAPCSYSGVMWVWASAANQTIYPYVHADVAGCVYNMFIAALRIK